MRGRLGESGVIVLRYRRDGCAVGFVSNGVGVDLPFCHEGDILGELTVLEVPRILAVVPAKEGVACLLRGRLGESGVIILRYRRDGCAVGLEECREAFRSKMRRQLQRAVGALGDGKGAIWSGFGVLGPTEEIVSFL